MNENKILKLGQFKTVSLITIMSILLSLIGSVIVTYFLDQKIDSLIFLNAIFMPLIIAPLVSWKIVSMYLRMGEMEKEMRSIATYDMLTGTLTRKVFFTNCDNLYHLIKRKQSILTIAYIDIDNFKKINDTYTHAGGDAILKSFGELLRNNLRKSDLIGRLGGEEFGLALPDTDLDNAVKLLTKIQLKIIESDVIHDNNTLKYTISIGVTSTINNNYDELETLFKKADAALYRAKNSGKNQIATES